MAEKNASPDVDGAARAKESAVGRGRGVAPAEPALGAAAPAAPAAPAACGAAGDRARREVGPRRPAAVGGASVIRAHLWNVDYSSLEFQFHG